MTHGHPEDRGLPEDRGGSAPFDDSVAHLGAEQPPPPKEPKKAAVKRQVVKTYDYVDNGALIYQVVRFEPKGFSQRRPDPDRAGKWVWG